MDYLETVEEEYIASKFEKFRLTNIYQAGIFLLASAGALLASVVLTIEYLERFIDPNKIMPCDFSAVLSCTEVAKSWQSTLLYIGEVPIPNSLLGIVAETIFLVIAVVLISNGTIAKWINYGMFFGVLGSTIFAYWLFYQEVFVINALCPWCLLLLLSQTVMFFSYWRYSVLNEVFIFPFDKSEFKGYQRLLRWTKSNWGFYLAILWVLAIAFFIVFHYGTALFN
jgi:uncharacterized membrane protein